MRDWLLKDLCETTSHTDIILPPPHLPQQLHDRSTRLARLKPNKTMKKNRAHLHFLLPKTIKPNSLFISVDT